MSGGSNTEEISWVGVGGYVGSARLRHSAGKWMLLVEALLAPITATVALGPNTHYCRRSDFWDGAMRWCLLGFNVV